MAPLNHLLQKQVHWEWTAAQESVFESLKAALTSSSVVAHYDPKNSLELACGTSLRVVIFHITPQGYKPIAFASKTLTSSEFAYAQIERKVLAIIFGVKKFHKIILI